MASGGAARSLKHSWNGAVSAGTVPNLTASVLKRQTSRMLERDRAARSARRPERGKQTVRMTHIRACCFALSTLMSGPPNCRQGGRAGRWSRSASERRGATKSG
jgi:hypothetical protein